MITYNKNQRLFHLSNTSISYYIYHNEAGYLETLYLGKKLDNLFNTDGIRSADVDNCSTEYFDCNENIEKTYSDRFRNGYSRLELSPHAKQDKRGAPIIIKKPTGSYETNFLYKDFEITEGIPALPNMPHANAKDNAMTLRLKLKEEKYNINLVLSITIYDDKDIIVKSLEVINNENIQFTMSRCASMQLDLPQDDYTINHFRGRWGKERDWITNSLTDGIQEISSNQGRSSHEENPFIFLASKNAAYDYGEVIGLNLIYSGNFKFRVYNDAWRGTHIIYGINDEDFEWILEPNSTFNSPQAVISYSYSGIDKMSQGFHDFIHNDLITYKHQDELKPILFNSWEGCFFSFNTESILSYIDDSKKIGAELFVLDDGWFGLREDDYTGLGDWYINESKVDLGRVIDHCHKNGMKFGIWFEPEMVNPISDLYKEHPEYTLKDPTSKTISIQRHQFHLDFANPEVVDNIYNQMIKIIDKYEIDYIKWDYNRYVMEHFSSYLDSMHQGEVYHRLVLGYYSLIERLTARYPNIMFEGCASGGGRFDLGTLYYTPQIWASDESDPVQRLFINYNTSLGYPLSTIGAHVNANPITPYKTKAEIALFGTYGYEMNPNKLNENEINELNEIALIYKKYHKDVIENGTLYHLSSPTHTNYYTVECVSKDLSKALVLWVSLLKEGDSFRFIKLRGLDSNKLYKNSFDNNTYSGAYYMNVGLNLSRIWTEEFISRLIILEEAK